MNMTELLGTTASVVVAASLTMKNIRWLRWVNLIGALLFSCYGLFIAAWPVFGLNAFIVLINSFFLLRLSRAHDQFAMLEVPVSEADQSTRSLLARFLEHYGPDLAQHQPDFPRQLPQDARVFFVLREVLPIGLFVCRLIEPGHQEILVDYAVPAWRDFQNARYVFEVGLKSFNWNGPVTFSAVATVYSHRRYLKRMGFQRDPLTGGRWLLRLGEPAAANSPRKG